MNNTPGCANTAIFSGDPPEYKPTPQELNRRLVTLEDKVQQLERLMSAVVKDCTDDI